ncbi:PHP domain-containing protein [Aggregatibacter actinomycetemcomitans]|uniref:PHP domain-containing protein n=1 Tax=Aggregatibacter actinomycetemcomitans TaxID=714 RepID=UPI0011DAFF1C|nr:PHP domain-containing protein [Aggregatibacter actinomycetemcomitans]TYA24847.1 PHP domain-containing protein [Aggregatibacter actinomycetemcomitans]
MTKYDLHCHSTTSDGVLSPTEVVLRAHEKGVNVLALTDHDTVAGVSEARQQAEKSGIRLINGVEISTLWENRSIHIVGLGFDISHEKLTALLAEQARLRDIRAQEIGAKLEKIGVENAYAEARKLAGEGEVTRAHYARHLVQIGKVSNDGQAFKRYLGQGKSAYVKPQWADIPTTIDIIHQAGGAAVLANPLRYTMTMKWVRKLAENFKSWGGDAMEISGCGQRPDQFQLLVKLAEEHQLAGSMGSDFHFPCAWVELGKLKPLPEHIPFVLNIKNDLA